VRNESENRAELIDPALRAAGWGVVDGSRIQREYHITKGRLLGAGRRSKPDIANYVLVYGPAQRKIGLNRTSEPQAQ